MIGPRRTILAVSVAVTLAPTWASMASVPYAIDPSRSEVAIHVGKAGALSFVAGHTHEITGRIERGTIDFDPGDPSRSHVHLAILATSLAVSSANEPPADVAKVQETMDSDRVLDVNRYPEVVFDSTSITVSARHSSDVDLIVAGQLSIHGVTHPTSVRVHATIEDQNVTASGQFSLNQTEYGITPIKVAGVVAVKDRLDINFTVVARRS